MGAVERLVILKGKERVGNVKRWGWVL
jgi:hypothetical protein